MLVRPVLALLLILGAAPLTAACGGVASPCEADGGRYVVETPTTPPPHPAIVFLHGYGGTGAGVLRSRDMVEAALARGYAVVAPQGAARRAGDTGGAWNSLAAPQRRDDVAFLRAVAADAAARFGLDRKTMLLAGFSGGGMMTWRAACDAPTSFAAYAPIAGLLWRPLPAACAGPVRMLHSHGWADPVVPLEGRAVAGGRITQGDLFAGLALMRRALGCARDAPDAFAKRGVYLIRRWTACAPGGELGFALHPAGHVVPPGWADLALDWLEASERD